MLKARPLDDKTYGQILESAMNRLPALCPTWTDYNAHDPGVTLLELFSWYEEMQRFHLDQMTDEIRRKLLALLNVTPRHASPARCRVDMEGAVGFWPEGALLHTDDISFELAESIDVDDLMLFAVFLLNEERVIDVTDLLNRDGAAVQPFLYSGEKTDLSINFSSVERDRLRLWFTVEQGTECPRNAFLNDSQQPREIRWFWNGEEITPISDETHALSVSGFVTVPVVPCGQGELRLVLVDPGCEETVRISAIKPHICRALQQKTWSRIFTDTVPSAAKHSEELSYAYAVDGIITAFLRTKSGWEQVQSAEQERTESGRRITLDSSRAAQDGEENLMLVCTTADYIDQVFFDSDGLPNQAIPLTLGNGQPVGELTLICDSLDTDGAIRPMFWHRVDDLNTCGARDRVFSYDPIENLLRFGDGRHGMVVPAGENSIFVASLQVSLCGKGNIPGGPVLRYGQADHFFTCTSGEGGAEAESCAEACIRFLRDFSRTQKCATAEDYARIAKATPGLRVAMAKALPGYDPNDPSGSTARPIVNVVVVPYSQSERPVPDQRFLQAVRTQLEEHRPICTEIGVLSPRYIMLNLQVRIRCDKSVSAESMKEKLREWFARQEIGQTAVKNDLALYIQKCPGVWKLDRLEMTSGYGDCRRSAVGDVILPQDGIACLGEVQIELL